VSFVSFVVNLGTHPETATSRRNQDKAMYCWFRVFVFSWQFPLVLTA
jgi:hypothetical protein